MRFPDRQAPSRRCSTSRRLRAASIQTDSSRADVQTERSAPQWCSRIRIPQYGGTMHTKVVYQAAKALARIGCAVLRFNFRGAGRSAGAFDEGARRTRRFPCRARLHARPLPGRSVVGGRHVVRFVGRADGRRRGPARARAHRHRHAGRSLRLQRRSRRATKPKFFIHGERDEICPLKQVREFYARAREPKELVVIDAADHLFDGKVGEVADAVEDLLGDYELTLSSSPPFAPPVGKAPERRRCAGPTRRARRDRDRRGAAPRSGTRAGGGRRRDPRLRDARGRAGPERRADCEPPRRHPGLGVGGHDQPVLLFWPSGDRVRVGARHVRLG